MLTPAVLTLSARRPEYPMREWGEVLEPGPSKRSRANLQAQVFTARCMRRTGRARLEPDPTSLQLRELEYLSGLLLRRVRAPGQRLQRQRGLGRRAESGLRPSPGAGLCESASCAGAVSARGVGGSAGGRLRTLIPPGGKGPLTYLCRHGSCGRARRCSACMRALHNV